MSYRLIDANAIASRRPEVNDMPCIYADFDKGLDGCHYDLRGANTLQAENAKLRHDLEEANNQVEEVCIENAKLRELVAQRTARRVVVSNAGTDHATGHCECSACGGAIDPWDAYCRHCGARMEEDA